MSIPKTTINFAQNVDIAIAAMSRLTIEVYSAGLRYFNFSVREMQPRPAAIGLVVVAHPGPPPIPVGFGVPDRTVVVDLGADRSWLEWVLIGPSTVVDGRLPIEAQLRSVAAAMRDGVSQQQARDSRRHLRRRLDEARRLETLTPRERVVLRSLLAGSSPADVARDETVALSTVRAQVRGIHDKLQVASLGEMLAMARRSSRLAEFGGPEIALGE